MDSEWHNSDFGKNNEDTVPLTVDLFETASRIVLYGNHRPTQEVRETIEGIISFLSLAIPKKDEVEKMDNRIQSKHKKRNPLDDTFENREFGDLFIQVLEKAYKKNIERYNQDRSSLRFKIDKSIPNIFSRFLKGPVVYTISDTIDKNRPKIKLVCIPKLFKREEYSTVFAYYK